jgi:hypothetical protein
VGSTPYTFQNVVVQCQEDPEVGLASELQAEGALLPGQSPAGGSSGGVATWVLVVTGVVAALLLSVAGVALVLLRHRRRRSGPRLSPGGGDKLASGPSTPRGSKMNKMESGELDELHLVAAAGSPTARSSNGLAAGSGSDVSGKRDGQRPLTPEQQQQSGEANRRLQDALWRSRQAQLVLLLPATTSFGPAR